MQIFKLTNISFFIVSFFALKSLAIDENQPLLLTPLIKSGSIKEARDKSRVQPFLPNIRSHAGFFTVNENSNSNIFFWFFKKTSESWINSPTLLWLQGGPGVSSMLGLFTENGPFLLTKNGLQRRKHAWTDHYNVLYIDNPIGTGFSFTNQYYVRTQEEIGEHLFESLLQFFKLFPELKKNDFFLTGESYAGKYIPAIAYTIFKKNLTNENTLNLKGLIIGNGYSDPENMHRQYGVYLHRLGLIDSNTRRIMELKQEKGEILIRSRLLDEAFLARKDIFFSLGNYTNFLSVYDYTSEKPTNNDQIIAFLQRNDVKNRIHVGNHTFLIFSKQVYDNLRRETVSTVKPWIEAILEHYPIMFFSGQLDIIVAHPLTSELLENLHWKGAEQYSLAKRKKWYFENQLVGYYKVAGNLMEAFVRGANHMVPIKKPEVMLDLLDKFINNKF